MSEALTPVSLNEIVQQTAFNVQAMTESLGLITSKMKDHENRIVSIEQRTEANEMRMQNFEDNERISFDQGKRMKSAVYQRCAELLGIKWENGVVVEGIYNKKHYLGGFIRRLWCDAKNHSYCAHSYTETRKRDYDETMKYIREWEPAAGVDGYMEYLDQLHEA